VTTSIKIAPCLLSQVPSDDVAPTVLSILPNFVAVGFLYDCPSKISLTILIFIKYPGIDPYLSLGNYFGPLPGNKNTSICQSLAKDNKPQPPELLYYIISALASSR
jgi:hypothetical protein